MPTIQEINEWVSVVEQWETDSKIWAADAVEKLENNQAIGSNPPTPPPPPPGCSYS